MLQTFLPLYEEEKEVVNEQALEKTHWAGRLERCPQIYLDGAHNLDSLG